MDPITHLVGGLAVAWTEIELLDFHDKNVQTQVVFWASLLGSQAPDLDVFLQLAGPLNYLKFHRVITHGAISIPIIALIIALIMVLFYSFKFFLLAFVTALISLLLHVFLDLLTVYGTVIYWPFKKHAYATNLLLVFDPILICVPILSQLFFVFDVLNEKQAFWIGAMIVAFYLLLRLFINKKLSKNLVGFYHPCDKVIVLPSYLSILKWKFVVKRGNSYLIGEIFYPTSKIKTIRHQYSSDDVPKEILDKANNAVTAQVFLSFAQFPLLRYRKLENGHLLQWTDLRYHFKGYEFFKATIFISNNNEIKGENLG